MKQQIILVFVIVFLTSASANKKQISDLERMNLKGNIKTLLEIVQVIYENSEKSIIFNTITNFNIDGMIVEKRILKKHTLFSRLVYNYNSENQITGFNDYNPDGSLYISVTYESDEDGFIIAEHYDRSTQRLYDEKRQPIDVLNEEYYEKLFTDIFYERDFKGYKLEEKYLKPNGALSHKYLYSHNYKYYLVEKKYYNSANNLFYKTKYKYNEHGDSYKSTTFISHRLGYVTTFTYEYDVFDNWVKREETKEIEDNIFTKDVIRDLVVTDRIIQYYVQ